MMEKKELISSKLIKKWSTPTRGKNLNDLYKRKQIAQKDVRELQDKFVREDWQIVNEYLYQCNQQILKVRKECDIQEVEVNSQLTAKQKQMAVREIKETFASKYDNLTMPSIENSNLQVVENGILELTKVDGKYKNDPRIFRPSPFVRMEKQEPMITLNGNTFLTKNGMAMITAGAGKGKSSVCLAICSKVANADCDGLGFDIPNRSIERIVFFDGELDEYQADENFVGMMKRADVSNERIEQCVRYIGTSLVESVMERREIIEQEIKEFNPQLVIIDGCADLLDDPNDGVSSLKLKGWIRRLNNNHNCSLIITIHPNPKDNKAQGHLGTKMWQECGSNILIKWDKPGMGIITSDFDFGKKRNSPNAHLNATYKWDNDSSMLVGCDAPAVSMGRPSKPSILQLTADEYNKMVKEWTAPLHWIDHIARMKAYIDEHYPNHAKAEKYIIDLNGVLKDKGVMVSMPHKKFNLYYADPSKAVIIDEE